MKNIKLILLLFSVSLLISCQKKTLFYEKVFEADLGFASNQIGSNLPILESYSNRQGFPNSTLLDVPALLIQEKKLYVADSYNKVVTIFPLEKENIKTEPTLSIPNKGKGYSFARPYEVFVDRNTDIYILASIEDFESYEVQNYSNQTAEIKNYDQFQTKIKNIPDNNFYIYKFSSQGDFLYKLGLNGINSTPFLYPSQISGDDFGNLYLYFPTLDTNQTSNYHVMRRYSSIGELNFEFNSKNIDIQTNVNNIYYNGNIISINNYKHDEQLAVLTEYQPLTNTKGEEIPANIENVWSSVNIYSILENDFTAEISKNKQLTEGVLGIDKDGRIFFQSYNEEMESLKIRVLDTRDNTENIYYTPIHSSYYVMHDYFLDNEGTLYNYILDRNSKVIVLQWNTEQTNTKSEL